MKRAFCLEAMPLLYPLLVALEAILFSTSAVQGPGTNFFNQPNRYFATHYFSNV